MTKRMHILALGLSLLHAATARGADVTADPVEAPWANLVKVVSPAAECAAVSDQLSLLAIGPRPRGDKAGEFYIFGLDASGNVVGTPAPAPADPAAPPPPPLPLFTVPLPRSDALATFPHGAHFMLFHPTLPLLYVWQDILGPPMTSAKENPVFKDFDHLLIYSLAPGQPPKLELATARGPLFMYNVYGPRLVMDGEGKRMFLPGLRSAAAADNSAPSPIGYAQLDAATGLPILKDGQLVLTIQEITAYNYMPAAMGFHFVSETMAIFANVYGAVTWDMASRRARLNGVHLAGVGAYNHRLVGHPTFSQVYLSGIATPYIHRMQHADGYLTMQPQRLTIGGASLTSWPVLMLKHNQIAVGGVNKVYVVSLDAAGLFAPSVGMAIVDNPAVEGLTYSEKFDRLYVTVEK